MLEKESKPLVRHIPALAVSKGNPKGIDSLKSLTRGDVRAVMGDAKSTALCFLLTVLTAYRLTREHLPCRRVVEVILELTMSLLYIVLGLSLLILFSSPLGKELKAAELADRVGILLHGMMQAIVPAKELFTHPWNEATQKFLGITK